MEKQNDATARFTLPRLDHEADSCELVYLFLSRTMRVVMFFVLLIFKLGFPTLYKAYEFVKSLFQPFRSGTHRTR